MSNSISAEDILYQDAYIIAVDKPAGLMVEPDRFGHENAVDQVLKLLQKKPKLKGGLGVLYRLDRPVRGVLIFALTPLALKELNKQIENRQITKIYRARLEGILTEKSGEWRWPLTKDAVNKKGVIDEKSGKPSSTKWKVLAEENPFTDIEIKLNTGRYHQIRAHAAFAGFPIVGDTHYGASTSCNEGIALIAQSYSFTHPITQKRMTVQTKTSLNEVHSLN